MEQTKKSINQVVSACKKGQKDGFEALVDIYSTRLFAYFYRLSGKRDTAEELLNELFIKIIEKISGFGGGNFDAWLFRMASNLFTDYLRSHIRRRKLLESAASHIGTEYAEPEKIDDGTADELTAALQNLDGETAELIVLRYYSQMSFEQIAKSKKLPLGTCLAKVHRGLKKLRQLMKNYND